MSGSPPFTFHDYFYYNDALYYAYSYYSKSHVFALIKSNDSCLSIREVLVIGESLGLNRIMFIAPNEQYGLRLETGSSNNLKIFGLNDRNQFVLIGKIKYGEHLPVDGSTYQHHLPPPLQRSESRGREGKLPDW
jgi:hypothetical protein